MTNANRERFLKLIDELKALVEAQDDSETIFEVEFIAESQDTQENAPEGEFEILGHNGRGSGSAGYVVEAFPTDDEVLDHLLLVATKKGTA